MKTFSQRVVEIALEIPKGRVTTYGRIAWAAGGGGQASRSVNGILEKAAMNGVKGIPFHRIVYADGTVWLHPTYKAKRLLLYKKEGIKLNKKNRIVDFVDVIFEFK